MKKKRIFKKLGSHESPCHSRKAAMRVKRSCEDYVRKLEWIHKRAVEHLKRENEALRRENKRGPHPFSIPAERTESACVQLAIDERFEGAIPHFVVSCERFAPQITIGQGVATYRFRLDYEIGAPMFTRQNVMAVIDRIQNLFRHVTKGNY